ncbi:hypothetical protein [Flavobacterium sp.]|uniref:hypothetical protein n=1 Tax=Flavobacterium sp. TaxID=239 RepID=UPI0035B428FB
MEKIIKEIVRALNENSENLKKSATETIKSIFAEKGKSLEFCTAAHSNKIINKDNYDEGEWLFDLVWYKMDVNDNQIMTEIPLVLESELSIIDYGGFKTDFDKLLVATSSTKVFVTTNHYVEEKMKYTQKSIDKFIHFRNNEFLYLIVLDTSELEFSLYLFSKNQKPKKLLITE